MKRLTIIYGDATLHDADVDEFNWTESDGYVAVTGKRKPAKAAPAGGLLDMLGQASRRKTDAKRAELIAEPTEES